MSETSVSGNIDVFVQRDQTKITQMRRKDIKIAITNGQDKLNIVWFSGDLFQL